MFDARQLDGQMDAVTIAVPTESHASIALPFLEAGIPVLVEKPIARTIVEADAHDRGGRRAAAPSLAVGHTERFNPAVAAARSVLADPRFIEVHRLGAFPERSLDIDVVFDLMIHDLDIALSLVGAEVETDRSGRRAGADRTRRHRKRAPAIRQWLHREHHRQPDQPRPRAENPFLPAGRLRVD